MRTFRKKIIAVGGVVVGLTLTSCGSKDAKPDLENNSSGNPLSAPADYLGAVNKAQKSAGRNIDMASLQQAIQMFQANEDRFPTNLQEVVAKNYLREVPTAPAGYRLTYNPKTGAAKMLRQ
ncbi:MAG: hypothetical protein ACO1QB_08650 [Verrucomicrobiales bacterium]